MTGMSLIGGAAVADELTAPQPGPRRRRWRGERQPAWRRTILFLALVFYLIPLLCSIKFSLLDHSGGYGLSNYTAIFHSAALRRVEIRARLSLFLGVLRTHDGSNGVPA